MHEAAIGQQIPIADGEYRKTSRCEHPISLPECLGHVYGGGVIHPQCAVDIDLLVTDLCKVFGNATGNPGFGGTFDAIPYKFLAHLGKRHRISEL